MKAILHIGLNKCGSTSIQNYLHNNEELIKSYGIYYKSDDLHFKNNFELYKLANYENNDQIDSYIENYILEANKNKAKTIVFSCENFMYLLEDEGRKIKKLIEILEKKGLQVEILLITRSIHKYLYSYIRQLAANGESMSQKNISFLAAYIMQLLQNLLSLNKNVVIKNIADLEKNLGLIKYFEKEVLGIETTIDKNLNLNKTDSRGFICSFLISQILLTESQITQTDINSENIDTLKTDLIIQIDKMFENNQFKECIQYLEEKFNTRIQQIIELEIKKIPHELKNLLEYFS